MNDNNDFALYFANPLPLNVDNGPDYITAAGTLTSAIVGPNYADAVSQGAVRPFWYGGSYVLTITDAATLASLFPESCAYELQLNVTKRNIVNCNGDDPYQNSAYYSFTVLLPT